MKKELLVKEILKDIYNVIINDMDVLAYLKLDSKNNIIVEYRKTFIEDSLLISFFDIGFSDEEHFINDYTNIIIEKLFQ